MDNLSLYLIKSIIIAAIYFIFYWLFLRHQTFYKLNRLFLILALLQAIILPLFEITLRTNPIGEIMNSRLPAVIINSEALNTQTQSSFSLSQILLTIYISGAVFLLFRFLNNLARIIYFYQRFPKIKYNGFTTIVLKGNTSSFTFFNTMFISEKDLEKDASEVVMHEMAHCRQLHSIDIIVAEIILIIQWFNPFVWLYRSALKLQHEFAADSYVLEKGHDVISYQQLLFERAVGFSAPGLISHFNNSLLKKRIYMLTKNKSKTWHRFTYWISVPMMLITALFFIVQPDATAQDSDVLMHQQVEIMPEYPGGIQAVKRHITENITYPEQARESKVAAKIYVSFVVDEVGKVTNTKIERTDILEKIKGESATEIVVVGYEPEENTKYDPNAITALENEAIRVINSLQDFEPGKNGGKNVKVQYTFPIQFVLE